MGLLFLCESATIKNMQGSSLNYYQILESSRTATAEEIRSSYKKLALQYHPDRVSNLPPVEQQVATEKMKLLSNAYATLKDPEKRANYDQQLLMNINDFDRQPYRNSSQQQFYTYRSSNNSHHNVRRVNPLFALLMVSVIIFLFIAFLSVAWPLLVIIIGINILLNFVRRM